MKRMHPFAILTLCWALALAPTSAQAGGRGEAVQKFLEFLGVAKNKAGRWVKRDKNVQEEVVENGQKTPYELAVSRLEIDPAPLKKAEDPFLSESTQNVFSSFRWKTIVRVMGQDNVMEHALSALSRKRTVGLAFVGDAGSGKSAVAETIEFAFRMMQKLNPMNNNHIVKVDTSKSEFKTLEGFERVLKNLQNEPEFKNTNKLVFHFEDLGHFSNQEKGHQAFADYVSALRDLEKSGVNIKITAEMNESAYDSLVKGTSLEKIFAKIPVKAVDDAPNVDRILRTHQLLEDPKNLSGMDDMKYAKLFSWLSRYFPGDSKPARGLQILDDARGSRKALLEYDILDKASDEVSEALRFEIDEMDRLMNEAAQYAKGAEAQRFLKEAPKKKALLEEQLQTAEKDFERVSKARDKINALTKELRDLGEKASKEEVDRIQKAIEKTKSEASELSERDIAIEISRRSGKPLREVLENSGRMTVEEFEKRMNEVIYGQPVVKKIVMRMIVKVAKAMESRSFSPGDVMGSIMFLGPPGTGKTEFARLIGEFMNGYYRIDAAQFKEPAWLSRLTGSAPGYAESEKGGQLTNYIMKHRQINLHVDEFERGSSEFMDILQQALNPAELTDSNGKVAQLYESIVTITSNLVRRLPEGFDPYDPKNLDELKDMMIKEASRKGKVLDPALLNRIQDFVFVAELDRDTKLQILHKFLRIYNDQPLMKSRFMKLEMTPKAREAVIEEVMKVADGSGRDVKRYFDNMVKGPFDDVRDQGQFTDPLTGKIKELSERIGSGDLIELDFDEVKGFSFRRVPVEEVL